MTPPVVLAQLAPAIEGIRLSLHVLAATVWVGGQITLAGLVPTARQLGQDAPRRVGCLRALAAGLHGRARTPVAVSIWGSVAGVTSLAALVMGVFLAG
ncbi:MAG: hypothetical protein M0005_05925 [Actinomycetota bacterium]|nr:hypothetical protein [Actinomycetota bacterium]